MKKEINSLLLKMQSGETCIGETADRIFDLFHKVSEPKFRLTSDHVIYFKGKFELLKKENVYILAGLKLSAFGNNSPFHYKGEIVRLPNSILEEI